MATQDTPDTGKVSIENSSSAPIATRSFRRIWNRFIPALNRREHDTGEDQVERGDPENPAKGTIYVEEGNDEGHPKAGTSSLNGPQAEAAKTQHHSLYSSTAFDRLPQPVPVRDIFFGSWWFILALRTATRPIVIYYSVSWMWSFDGVFWTICLALYLFRWLLLRMGHDTVPLLRIPIPGKRRIFWGLSHWIQKHWEHIIGRIILRKGDQWPNLCGLWWFIYMLIAPMAEFRQNYVAAWRQRKELSIYVFVDDENMSVPIPVNGTDQALLARIRSFYQMMLIGQDFPALVFPKQLQRIDYVEISKDNLVLGSRLGTLQLGRYKGRLVNIFENPELGEHTIAVAEIVRTVSEKCALEFQRTYNVGAISVVVAVPPVASLIFAIAWIRIYVFQRNIDTQIAIQTAFTVSSYIVTAGALTLALIAFLDQKRAENDDMLEKIARRHFETRDVTTSKPERRISLP